MGWIEDLFFMGGFSNFVQNVVFYLGGQGEVERFMIFRVREELLRYQLLEKRSMGMQRFLGMVGSGLGQGMEMERMMQAYRQMDSVMFFGQMVGGEGLAGIFMGMEFGGGRGFLSFFMGQFGLREVDLFMGLGNFNMNMNVNMNMNMNLNVQMISQQQMLMLQKMRGFGDMMGLQGFSFEEMVRVRVQNSSGMMGGSQKMFMFLQFFNQGQQGFFGGQGFY